MTDQEAALHLAHGALLALLVTRMKHVDPNFEQAAPELMDTIFGMLLDKNGKPKPFAPEARKIALSLIGNPRNALDNQRNPPPTKKMTLRRHFLDWLNRS